MAENPSLDYRTFTLVGLLDAYGVVPPTRSVAARLSSKQLVNLAQLCPPWARFVAANAELFEERGRAAMRSDRLSQIFWNRAALKIPRMQRVSFIYEGDEAHDTHFKFDHPHFSVSSTLHVTTSEQILAEHSDAWAIPTKLPQAMAVQYSDDYVVAPEIVPLFWLEVLGGGTNAVCVVEIGAYTYDLYADDNGMQVQCELRPISQMAEGGSLRGKPPQLE